MNHLQLHEENCKSKHVLAYISSLFPLCPIPLYSEKLIRGGWLAQDLRESLHSSLGAASCTGGKQNKVWRCEGLVKTHQVLRLLWCPVEESDLIWPLLQPAGLVQSNPPSSHLFQGSQSYPYQYAGTAYAPGITSTMSRTQMTEWPR